MRKHSGMRPQDIAILLKIVALDNDDWKLTDLSTSLGISQSEISEALHRCQLAGLIDPSKRKLRRTSFLEFLIHGLKYVFPEKPGSIVKGMPTAHSAFPLSKALSQGNEVYVWPDAEGTARGQSIAPLYRNAPMAARNDKRLYELLSLVDALRVGKAREYRIAAEKLQKQIGKYGKEQR